jgi:hypothetical protein
VLLALVSHAPTLLSVFVRVFFWGGVSARALGLVVGGLPSSVLMPGDAIV